METGWQYFKEPLTLCAAVLFIILGIWKVFPSLLGNVIPEERTKLVKRILNGSFILALLIVCMAFFRMTIAKSPQEVAVPTKQDTVAPVLKQTVTAHQDSKEKNEQTPKHSGLVPAPTASRIEITIYVNSNCSDATVTIDGAPADITDQGPSFYKLAVQPGAAHRHIRIKGKSCDRERDLVLNKDMEITMP